MHPNRNDIGSYVAVRKLYPPVAALTAAEVKNGDTFDRETLGMPQSIKFRIDAGAVTGAPTAISVIAKLQQSVDNSVWTDVVGAVTAAITAANTGVEQDWPLVALARYVRVVTTVALTAGTAPTIFVQGVAVFEKGQTLS